MRHLKDALNLMQQGDGPGALDIINTLLELAPKNTEALRLKARILDSWGQFDSSFELLRQISHMDAVSDEAINDLEGRLQEERESLVFSELTAEGRWYFAFPKAQVWVSVYGFFGCATFLLISSHWLNQGTAHFPEMVAAFVMFVVLPWIALMVVHFTGIKKILVGLEGIKVCTRFSTKSVKWGDVSSAVIEYDPDINIEHLKLLLYSKSSQGEALVSFNISAKSSVVRARRHFVRSLLTYVDCVTYRANVAEPIRIRSSQKDSENRAA